jgi:ELWxxDGT repeat protein
MLFPRQFIAAICILVAAFAAANAVHAQKYSLTRIANNNGVSMTAAQTIVYDDRLYYFDKTGSTTGAIYRDSGSSSDLVRSLTFTSGATMGPIIDGQLYYTKDGLQYSLDDPSQQPISSATPGVTFTSTSYLATLNGKQLFYGTTAAGTRLYRRDAQGLVLVGNPSGSGDDFDLFDYTVFNNQVYFSAKGPSGNELYRTDGNSINLVADILPGTGSSNPGDYAFPTGFRQVGSNLLFDAIGPNGRELYRYDGASVSQVADIRPGSLGSDPTHLMPYHNSLIFSAFGPSGNELYIWDAAGGARLLANINTGSGTASSGPGYFVLYKDWLYFQAAPNGVTTSLYRTNGVEVDPLNITNPDMVRIAYDDKQSSIYKDKLYFSANAGIYSTDGTTFSIIPGAETNTGQPKPAFTNFAGDLIMSYDKGQGLGVELYRWNGTTFSLISDINPGCTMDAGQCFARSGDPDFFLEANGVLYFLASNGTTGLYRMTASAPNGDFNFDGTVDMSDYVVWRQGLGTRYTQADYDNWRAHFGSVGPPPGAGSAAGVPEPSLLPLIAGMILAIARIRSVRH